MVLGAAEYMTGSTGNEVKQIQAALAFAGYLQTAPDGLYGPMTKEAVQRFQSDKGLAIDGIVGPNTWAALFGGSMTVPTAPTIIPKPTVTPIPSTVLAVAGRPGGSSMFSFLDSLSSPMMIVGGLGLLALVTMGGKAPRSRRRRRR